MDKNDFAISISSLAAVFTGWQAWTAHQERSTPMQVLVYQSQVSAVQNLAEHARTSCQSALCDDGGVVKHGVCKGDDLETAFGKVEATAHSMKLIASPEVMDVVSRFPLCTRDTQSTRQTSKQNYQTH
jgi:uncharacterized protein YPO0396